ncbi:hypothetical protein HDV00_005770 [Rhizophlyctis rosea]|nr:hypothetical protein HDV00_005770 [Rhizophlyctis rosea]
MQDPHVPLPRDARPERLAFPVDPSPLGPGISSASQQPKSKDSESKDSNFLGSLYQHAKSGYKGVKALVKQSVKGSTIEHIEHFTKLDDVVEADMKDNKKNPEILRDAAISRENMITAEEQKFKMERLESMRASFAKFIGVSMEEVDVRDIPIIGAGGSGGGFKAMIATAGFFQAMEELGFWDCMMYISGVSGACWTLGNLYTAAEGSPTALVNHFVQVCRKHPFDLNHVDEIISQDPTRIYLIFGGLMQKYFCGLPRGIVDLYGAILAAHFFHHPHDREFRPEDFKFTAQIPRYFAGGQHPLPIYTAVRHARPWKDREFDEETAKMSLEEYEKKTGKKLEQIQDEFDQANEETEMDEKMAEVENEEAWWQWFEFSPFQIGSEELRVWFPTWSFGRRFVSGNSIDKVPEINFSTIFGLTASAMCLPFSKALATVNTLQGGAKSTLTDSVKSLTNMLMAPNASDFIKNIMARHFIHSSFNWNPLYDPVKGQEVKKPGIWNSKRIQWIDAGVDNNQPFYAFTREGRDVDIVFVLDSSTDVERDVIPPDFAAFSKRLNVKLTRTSPEPATGRRPPPDAAVNPQFPGATHEKPSPNPSDTTMGAASNTIAQLSNAPPPQPQEQKPEELPTRQWPSSHIREFFSDRYCQTFHAEPVDPRGEGTHGEPNLRREMELIYMPNLRNGTVSEQMLFGPSDVGFSKLEWKDWESKGLAESARLNFHQEVENVRRVVRGVWERKRAARVGGGGR